MRRLRRILSVLLVAGLVFAAVVAGAGCTTTVTPPRRVSDGVTVYVIDHGHTPSLLLPTPEGGAVRYAYGDWRYYAESQRNPLRDGIPALLWPTSAAVGRQPLDRMPAGDPRAVALATSIAVDELHDVEVERAEAEALYRDLEAHFTSHWEARLHNPAAAMTFVPHPDAYSLAHDSNDVVGQWLEEMGAQTRGPFWAINWRIEDE